MPGRRPVAGAARALFDAKALCKALGISPADEATQRFLTLVEHDLLYLTDRRYRESFEQQLEDHGLRRKKAAGQQQPQPVRRRGRPADDVARSLVRVFISRLESVLELELKPRRVPTWQPLPRRRWDWIEEKVIHGAALPQRSEKRQIGFSKSGGKLYDALQIYLEAAGKSMPERHMPPADDPLLYAAERAINVDAKPAVDAAPRRRRRKRSRHA